MPQAPNSMLRGPGRPPWQPPHDFWSIIERYATAGLTGEECAAYLGISYDTLVATEGFRGAWERKKHARLLEVAERAGALAVGEAEASMPQAVSTMYWLKARGGGRWYDRPSEVAGTGQPVHIQIVFAGSSPQVRVVEGTLVANGPPALATADTEHST